MPVGSCEQHGPHLPLAHRHDRRRGPRRPAGGPPRPTSSSARRSPSRPAASTPGSPARCRSGTDATATVIVELVRSADWSGGVVLVNGHGGNRDAVDRAITTLGSRRAAPPCRGGRASPGGDAHAGRTETSLLLALRPDLVRLDRAAAGVTAPLDVIAVAAAGDRRPRRGAQRRARRPVPARRPPRATPSWPSSPTTWPRAVDDVGWTSAGVTTYSLDATTHRPGEQQRGDRRLAAATVPPHATPASALFERHRRRRRRRRRRVPPAASSTASSTPGPSTPAPACGPFTAADVTVVVPAFVLGESGAGRDRALLPRRRRGHRRRRRLRPAGGRGRRLTRAAPAHQRRAGRRPQRRPRCRRHAARRVRRHRRPAATGLARRAARPLRRRAGRARRAPRRQRPRRRPDRRIRAGPLAARPRAGARTHRARHPPQLRPGGGDRRADRRAARRSTASIASCASARTSTPCGGSSRPGGAAATNRRASSTTAHAGRGGRSSPSAWPTARRRRRSPTVTRARSRRCASAGGAAAAWGLLAAGQPIPAVAVAGGTTVALDPQAARRPGRRSRCGSPALGHLYAGRLLADAGRRAWWPLLLAGAVVSKRMRRVAVAAAVPALLSRRHPEARRRPRLRRRAVEGRRRRPRDRPVAAPLHVVARSLRRGLTTEPPACTVVGRDAAPDRRHRRLAGPRRHTSPGATPASCRS